MNAIKHDGKIWLELNEVIREVSSLSDFLFDEDDEEITEYSYEDVAFHFENNQNELIDKLLDIKEEFE